ncbi:MAG: DUF309 domain-containing protein [Aliarcobacter sp.]|nr:DUF309 domain-containing protein [Aliarcobacter sp.]
MDINLKLQEIIFLLKEERFVQVHDIFEKLWREYKNDKSTREESFILKAFVNASVSIELYKMNRFEHSINVWNTYKKYENLIETLKTKNSFNYKNIKKIIYEKREKYIK